MRFSGTPEKRGVLTPEEAAKVFKADWKDKRAYAGNLLSLTTGLRAGEVLAIRKSDIEDRILNIRHSYSAMEGLKSPKNGETRRVPLLPEVRAELMELLSKNPHKVDEPYIFYGLLPDKPMDIKILIKGLKDACKTAGIDAPARGIVFHSWRHFYSARMADKAAAEEIMRVTGHKDKAVFDDYADHVEVENLRKMEKVTRKVMANIIPFEKASGV
jgi:integrase